MSCKYRKQQMEQMAQSLASATGCSVDDARNNVKNVIEGFEKSGLSFRKAIKMMSYFKTGETDDLEQAANNFIISLPGYADEITAANGDRAKIDPTHAFSIYFDEGQSGGMEFAAALPSGRTVSGYYSYNEDEGMDGEIYKSTISPKSQGENADFPLGHNDFSGVSSVLSMMRGLDPKQFNNELSQEDIEHLTKIQVALVGTLANNHNFIQKDAARLRIRTEKRQSEPIFSPRQKSEGQMAQEAPDGPLPFSNALMFIPQRKKTKKEAAELLAASENFQKSLTPEQLKKIQGAVSKK